jgi:glycosyltransferase involved in cell wall biosynthesis
MFVTVLMSVFNARATLGEAIDSVLRQSHEAFEFLIMDDGSTDGSAEILSDAATRDSRVRVLTRRNRGMGASLNEGLAHARTEWIVRIDADDVMLPDRLARQIDFVRHQEDLAVAGCLADYIDARGRRLGRSWSDLRTRADLARYMATGEAVGLTHPSAILRRSAVLRAGGYRPQYWPADDVDLWNRLTERGWVVLVQQEVLLRYRIHSSSVSVDRPERARLMFRWARDSMTRRRVGLHERSLEDFVQAERALPIWSRLNLARKETAKLLYKEAVRAYGGGHVPLAIGRLVAAAALQPSYSLRQVRRKFLWS